MRSTKIKGSRIDDLTGKFNSRRCQSKSEARLAQERFIYLNLETIKNINRQSKSEIKRTRKRRGRSAGAPRYKEHLTIENSTKKAFKLPTEQKSPIEQASTQVPITSTFQEKSLLKAIEDDFYKNKHAKSALQRSRMQGGNSLIYDLSEHNNPQGYYYDSKSVSIPFHYSRPGPFSYQPNQTLDSNSKFEQLSKYSKQPGQIFGKSDLPSREYSKVIPKHRFSEYSKKQIHSALLEKKNTTTDDQEPMTQPSLMHLNTGKVSIEHLLETVNMDLIEKDKKLDILNPSRSQIHAEPKKMSFTKTKRPELFPVKDEHKTPPCSYLSRNFTLLSKKAAMTNQTMRFAKDGPGAKTPGPNAYRITIDPGVKLGPNQLPLTNHRTFITSSNISKQERKTIFSNKFKQFDTAYERDISNTGPKIGPGPATLNLRETVKLDRHTNFSAMAGKSTLSKKKRPMGEPFPNSKMAKIVPGPTHYKVKESLQTIKNSEKFRSKQKFLKSARVIDFVKFSSEKEQLIRKGII